MIDLKSAAIKGVPTKGAAIFTKWLVCVVVISFSASLMAQDKPETKSWDELPDWSGWWDARGVRNTGGLGRVLGDLQVYQPEARQIIQADRVPGANLGGGSLYCLPTRFNGASNGGIVDHVEFLLRPDRLTITNENGLLRRIPIDGRVLPDNPELSNGGTSVGYWEGDTLVVETVGLHPDTTFPTASRPNSAVIGKDVRVLERIRLNENDQLVVETELTAPEMLVRPISYTSTYRRNRDHTYRDHDVCSQNDRSIDPETGLQRFDLTPPADLPPPPGG